MPIQDTTQLKEKIILILKKRGPSLPVHIAKETGLSMLFASAFLSELFSEKKIKISNMKVGNSPIYFIPEQKFKLENFSHHLKSKEKDAFILLKEKKFLQDKIQEPAIRVALRAIKDFAIPFKKNEEIFWRYFTISEKELSSQEYQLGKEKIKNIEIKKTQEQNKPEEKDNKIKEENLDIFAKPIEKEKKPVKKKKVVKKKTKKQGEKLFQKVKKFLIKENIEILDFQSLNKDELILKVLENKKEKMLIAYKKKRVTDLDIIKSYKKIDNKEIPYILLIKGKPSKKLLSLIETFRKLEKIKDIEKDNSNN